MCFGKKTPPSAPAPPPPAPPIAPLEIAPSEDAATGKKRKKLGLAQLQIPLGGTPAAGLGIPKVA